MSDKAIDSEIISKPAPEPKPKAHKAGKKAKSTKKVARANKPAAKPMYCDGRSQVNPERIE
jgi:hypothetical protein